MKKRKLVGIRPWTHSRIAEMADDDDLNVSEYADRILTQHIQDQDQEMEEVEEEVEEEDEEEDEDEDEDLDDDDDDSDDE